MKTSGKRPHIERITAEDYEQLYPDRLGLPEIDEHTVHSLLVRSRGKKFNAYRLTVNLDQIKRQLASAAFKTILLDADLRPATRQLNSMLDENNNWSSTSLKLIDSGKTISTKQGFFVPPQPDAADLFLMQSEELTLSK